MCKQKKKNFRYLFLIFCITFVMFSVTTSGETQNISEDSQFIRWHTTAFGTAWYHGNEIKQVLEANDGSYIAIGNSSPAENKGYTQHALISKFNKNGTIAWDRLFGGGIDGKGSVTVSANYYFNKVIQLKNGDFLAVGYTNDYLEMAPAGYNSVYVVRIDNSGNTLWQKAYGLKDKTTHLNGWEAQENNDGTISILGSYQSAYNSNDRGYPAMFELNISNSGVLNDKKLITDDFTDSTTDATACSIKKTIDGGYIAFQNTFIDAWSDRIIKLNANGQREWGVSVHPKDDSVGTFSQTSKSKITVLPDGYLITAVSYIRSTNQLFVYRLNLTGEVMWAKLFSNLTLNDNASDINTYQTSENDIMVAVTNGYSTTDFTVAKISDSDGSVQWVKSYGNKTGFERNYGGNANFCILPTSDDKIIGVGGTYITKFAGDGLINFNTDNFTYQARENYQIKDVEISTFDVGVLEKRNPNEEWIFNEKDISILTNLHAADSEAVTEESNNSDNILPVTVINNTLNLTWNAVNGAIGYNIYRSETKGLYTTPRVDFSLQTTSFVDDQCEVNKTYYYEVRPVMSDGNEGKPIAEFVGNISTDSNTNGNLNKIILQIDNPNMTVNGEAKEIDPGRGTVPLIISGRTVLPIRAMIEAMGGTISWDATTKSITINAKNTTIVMEINNHEIVVNGVKKEIDVPPLIKNDRTMVPLRFAAENLGCTVDWIQDSKMAIVSY